MLIVISHLFSLPHWFTKNFCVMGSKRLPHFAVGEIVKGFGRGSKELGIPTGISCWFLQIHCEKILETIYIYYIYTHKSLRILPLCQHDCVWVWLAYHTQSITLELLCLYIFFCSSSELRSIKQLAFFSAHFFTYIFIHNNDAFFYSQLTFHWTW